MIISFLILDCIRKQHKTFLHVLPYVLVQVRMQNNKEYKVVLVKYKAKYVAYNCFRQGKAYSVYPHTIILNFAEQAVIALSQKCPSAILEGLVRVDIFQRANGQLVVNEFESFEADHHASHEKNLQADYEVQLYYENILKTIVPSKFLIN